MRLWQSEKWLKGSLCLLTVFFLLGLVACGKEEVKEETAVPVELAVKMATPQPEIKAVTANQNLLTGVCDLSEKAIGKRPVSVMINNVEPALPQYGITQADVIFEIPVEGNLTRLMALYADYTKVPDICAVRSCRYYFPAFAKGFDAFYVHWGSDQTILDYLDSLDIKRYDGLSNAGGLFTRDSARRSSGYALEHTGVFKGTQFASVVESDGSRLELLDSKKGTAFQFGDINTVLTPTGSPCSVAKVNFGSATATLTYDANTNTYLKQINGHDHVDGKTGQTLSFTNAFILETSISIRDSEGHKQVDWSGGSNSTGYYLSNGVVERIHWQKDSEGDYLKFYKETGEELLINRGKSYIAVNYAGQASFE